jgi:hypothetical protein
VGSHLTASPSVVPRRVVTLSVAPFEALALAEYQPGRLTRPDLGRIRAGGHCLFLVDD